uniref:Holliday junction branch migration protein RuvA n=1 Tax=Alloprevotella sp. TaxID=1872471 RepID=UPI0015B1EC9C
MIEYIRGIVDELTPTQAIIEAKSGVGYALSISLNTYTAIQNKNEVRLFVYEVIREDAYLLFGFATRTERELFELLISISGVGGQTARMILSAFTPADLANIVQSEDVRSLKSVKGIGPKAAQRIIVELKDKMANFMGSGTASQTAEGANVTVSSPVVDEAVQALAVLGFSPAPTQKVVMQIVKDDPSIPVEGIIKKALKML